MRALLVLYYFAWLLPVSLARRLLRHDPLQLRRPNAESYWLAREATADSASYFSEASPTEGAAAKREGPVGGASAGRSQLLLAPLSGLARLWAPPRTAGDGKIASAADRNQDIPDEIYTLW
jgi:hypothetical protein